MALIPGAMEAGLVNAAFWASMMIALTAAFLAACTANRYLLQHGKGQALMHEYHSAGTPNGARRYIPTLATSTLVDAITPPCWAVSSCRSQPNSVTDLTTRATAAVAVTRCPP